MIQKTICAYKSLTNVEESSSSNPQIGSNQKRRDGPPKDEENDKEHKNGPNYKSYEDIAITRFWSIKNLDGITGTNQSDHKFKNSMFERFAKIKDEYPSGAVLRHHRGWPPDCRRFNNKINIYLACYDKFKSMNVSGVGTIEAMLKDTANMCKDKHAHTCSYAKYWDILKACHKGMNIHACITSFNPQKK